MRICLALLATLLSTTILADQPPTGDALEKDAAVIGKITLDKATVFDLSIPGENNWLYRLANRLHIVTQDKVINKQLLFESGDVYSSRLVDESARLLRQNRYLYDADIRPARYENGVVDLVVKTRDVWTLNPDVSVSRSGGENRTKYGLEDTNLLGRGQLVRVARIENVDRRSDSFEFADQHLGRSWVSTYLKISNNSDGETRVFSAVRPFYALDTRWSAGGSVLIDDRRTALYAVGEEAAEFRHERDYLAAFGGWSRGLQDGWVSRWTAGIVSDDNQFSEVTSPTLPAAIPENRRFVYPFLALEIVEDQFETAENHDQIGKTEDFSLGSRLSASVGWASDALGSDRDALIYSAAASRGFGSLEQSALLLSAVTGGRVESGRAANSVFSAVARYYHRQSEKRLFYSTISVTVGRDLDRDNPVTIGGDNGLRGYPLRYQSGDSKLLVTLEQRYFTDWYPFRLVRIGGAVFADAGRVWGTNAQNERRYDWLADVGFGLRFAPTRSSAGKMVHLDIAFPLGGDASIDTVQILLESKRSF